MQTDIVKRALASALSCYIRSYGLTRNIITSDQSIDVIDNILNRVFGINKVTLFDFFEMDKNTLTHNVIAASSYINVNQMMLIRTAHDSLCMFFNIPYHHTDEWAILEAYNESQKTKITKHDEFLAQFIFMYAQGSDISLDVSFDDALIAVRKVFKNQPPSSLQEFSSIQSNVLEQMVQTENDDLMKFLLLFAHWSLQRMFATSLSQQPSSFSGNTDGMYTCQFT